jgi:hypothetical protein
MVVWNHPEQRGVPGMQLVLLSQPDVLPCPTLGSWAMLTLSARLWLPVLDTLLTGSNSYLMPQAARHALALCCMPVCIMLPLT